MSNYEYSLSDGLELLVPGAKYAGGFLDSTEAEYLGIVWGDEREQPPYADVVQASLNSMRLAVYTDLEEVRELWIENMFEWPSGSGLFCLVSIGFRDRVLRLYVLRESQVYPYNLSLGPIENGCRLWSVTDASAIATLLDALNSHVEYAHSWFMSETASLSSLSKEELQDYVVGNPTPY